MPKFIGSLLIFSCISLIIGCSPSKRSNSSDADRIGEVAVSIHYVGDDKYQNDLSSEELLTWKKAQQQAILEQDQGQMAYDLFSHHGGGPLGAEWNSDADLWLALRYPSQGEYSPKILLNGEEQKISPDYLLTDSIAVASFTLPATVWIPLLKPISKEEYTSIYSQEAIKSQQSSPNGQLGIGKILHVESIFTPSRNGKNSLSLAFHIAFGE